MKTNATTTQVDRNRGPRPPSLYLRSGSACLHKPLGELAPRWGRLYLASSSCTCRLMVLVLTCDQVLIQNNTLYLILYTLYTIFSLFSWYSLILTLRCLDEQFQVSLEFPNGTVLHDFQRCAVPETCRKSPFARHTGRLRVHASF